MSVLIWALVWSMVYLFMRVINVILHNYRAHQFFQIRSPQLPVVPDPNIFLGNIDRTIYDMRNYNLIDEWHNRLGKSFGHYMVDQPWISTKDINLLKKVMLDGGNNDRMSVEMPIPELNNSIVLINGDAWHRVRMALAPSLTNLRVRSDAVTCDINRVIGQFIASLERKLDKAEQSTGSRTVVLSIHDQMRRITMAIVFLVLYKQDNKIDFDVEVDDFMQIMALADLGFINSIVRATWALPFLHPIATWLNRFSAWGRATARIVEYINQAVGMRRHAAVQQRKSDNQTEPDERRLLLDVFIDEFLKRRITYDQLIGTAYSLVLAGYDTTATSEAGLLFELAQNYDIQDKLRETLLTEGMDADYVVWCIMESVRCFTPVPLGTGRTITKDITTDDGLLIPKGSYVTPSAHSIHRDDSIWPEADKFMPERWRHQSEFHPAAFLGFGLGARNCPGIKLAIQESKLIIKAILTKYKVERCEETVSEYDFVSPGLAFTIPAQPIMLRFTPLDLGVVPN